MECGEIWCGPHVWPRTGAETHLGRGAGWVGGRAGPAGATDLPFARARTAWAARRTDGRRAHVGRQARPYRRRRPASGVAHEEDDERGGRRGSAFQGVAIVEQRCSRWPSEPNGMNGLHYEEHMSHYETCSRYPVVTVATVSIQLY